ncbi:MAG: hypothetical protein KBC11_02990 [Candidatus Pacebacteria bacterium]|nr:hypothetical protein [Candidatus Paceibacterota bacterium]
MKKKKISAIPAVFLGCLSLFVLLVTLFFKDNIIWEDLAIGAKFYFNRVGFGLSSFLFFWSIFLFIRRKILNKKRPKQSIEWWDKPENSWTKDLYQKQIG